ncbi:MAG: leucine-rich repeat domain-containing protein [bacterium]
MKKILSVIFAVSSIALLVGLTGCTKTIFDEFENEYVLKSGELTLTEINGDLTTLKIPSSIDEYAVTAIGENAFLRAEDVVSVTIPNSIKFIASDAFHGSDVLGEIILEEGNEAYKLINGNLYDIDVTTIFRYVVSNTSYAFSLPSTVTTINDFAFAFGQLYNITLPSTLEKIDNYAFYRSELIMISIPETVVSIGSWVFSGCFELAVVNLPKNITSIGDGLFNNCYSLLDIEIPSGVTSIGSQAFYQCKVISEIIIPDTVTSINHSAFDGCIRLKEIFIPSSVETINGSIFGNCNITISTSLSERPSGWSEKFNSDNTVNWNVTA